MLVLIVAALGASTALAAPLSPTDEQAARQADQAFVNAMN
jgi:hypothetical protein